MIYKIDPTFVVKSVYNMCRPVGMGFLQYKPGELSDEEATGCIHRGHISMDYVNGRQCKFGAVITDEGVSVAVDYWYDHTREELMQLHRILAAEESRLTKEKEHES